MPALRRWTVRLLQLAVAGVSLLAITGIRADPAAYTVTTLDRFDQPWALAFLPDGRLLVSEMDGRLKLRRPDGTVGDVSGIPAVDHRGQGGLGDIVLHPDFERNGLLYFSFVETGAGDTRGAAMARGRLVLAGDGGELRDVEVIWRQVPKVSGEGHYSHRIAFGPDGYLWISSGERQKFTPAQDMNSNLGKILRLNDDGAIPADNPFSDRGGITAQIWSLGHRNVLGLAFDPQGRLWEAEMGPKGGDELNLVRSGANYGYPLVSEGDHYDGASIPRHATRPEFQPPAIAWTPVISPSSLMFYTGDAFPDWQGDAFIGGLSSRGLVRIEFDGDSPREAQRIDLGLRARAVAQGPDGALWVLEDGRKGDGRLLKLSPAGS